MKIILGIFVLCSLCDIIVGAWLAAAERLIEPIVLSGAALFAAIGQDDKVDLKGWFKETFISQEQEDCGYIAHRKIGRKEKREKKEKRQKRIFKDKEDHMGYDSPLKDSPKIDYIESEDEVPQDQTT